MVRAIEDLFSYVFIWHSLFDACPKCRALNGREYRGQTIDQAVLIDSEFGEIWDLTADKPLTHLHCRCHLECKASLHIEEWEPYIELQRSLNAFE